VTAAGERFPCLDGARAVAATAVLLTHVAFFTGALGDGAVGRVLARLDIGVPVFFVLSGFLLARPFLAAAVDARPAPGLRAYLWRRAVRILPLYWLVVVVALLALPGNAGAGAGVWARHLLLVQIYTADGFADGLSHTWSLATEASFYLLLPVLALGLAALVRGRDGRPRGALVALAVAGVVGPAWVGLAWALPTTFVPVHLWLPGALSWFGGGVLLALLTVADPGWRPVRWAQELAAAPGTCWAGAGVAFWLACTPLGGPISLTVPHPATAVVRCALYSVVAVLLVLPLVLGDPTAGRVRRALSGRVARRLGAWSYGVFLVHVPVLSGLYAAAGWAPFTGSAWLVAPLVGVVSTALAAAAHVLVERPAHRLRHLVPDRGARPQTGRTTSATSTARAR